MASVLAELVRRIDRMDTGTTFLILVAVGVGLYMTDNEDKVPGTGD